MVVITVVLPEITVLISSADVETFTLDWNLLDVPGLSLNVVLVWYEFLVLLDTTDCDESSSVL